MKRCRKSLALCLTEGLITLLAVIGLVTIFGKNLLAIFNSDPEVISVGYVRLLTVMKAHIFNLLYETFAGYLRGFGISVLPAILTMVGVCGSRLLWIVIVFANDRTFQTLMYIYPVSLIITSLMIFIPLVIKRPSRYYEKLRQAQ